MLTDGLADDLTDGETRRQAGIRILKDDLHARTHTAKLFLAEGEYFLAVEPDLTGGLFEQAQNCSAGSGFAAAGFADKTHGLAALDLEADAVHSADVADGLLKEAGLYREPLYKVLDLKQVFVFRVGCFFDFFHLYSSSTLTDLG